MNSDYREALIIVRLFKVLVSALAVGAILFGAAVAFPEGFNDHRDLLPALGQGLAGTALIAVLAGIGWAILMLPLWLIAGHLRRAETQENAAA